MENSNNSSAPVSPVELLKRQIRDWQQLKENLFAAPEQTHQTALDITYCEDKIEELETELAQLSA